MSVKIYMNHDDEFGIVINDQEIELSILYIPSNNLFVQPEFGNEFEKLIDFFTNEGLSGETVTEMINQIQSYFSDDFSPNYY